MAGNINRVIITGNLTKDPDLSSLPNSGTSVCSLRVAVNGRRKNCAGEWEDKPNYFDVTVWGQQGENCAKYLKKGRPVAIDGRLRWREWDRRRDKSANPSISSLIPCSSSAGAMTPERERLLERRQADGERRPDRQRRLRDSPRGEHGGRRRHSVLRPLEQTTETR